MAGSLVFSLLRPLTDAEKEVFKAMLARNDGIELENWHDQVASWAAWPLGSWRGPRLFHGDWILAGTLAGLVSPVLLFGVNGALVSGRVAAMAVEDPDEARREFRRLAPLYWPQFLFRKLREYLPHALLKPLSRIILSTYNADSFHHAMLFVLYPPGCRKNPSGLGTRAPEKPLGV